MVAIYPPLSQFAGARALLISRSISTGRQRFKPPYPIAAIVRKVNHTGRRGAGRRPGFHVILDDRKPFAVRHDGLFKPG